MGLPALEILNIAELVFFTPALLASIAVVCKHGGNKLLGWRFLILICLFRVAGAILSMVGIHHPSTGVITAADVMNSFGLSSVIYTALGLLSRVENSTEGHGLPVKVFRLLGLPGLAAIILSIIGSTNVFSSDPSDSSTGFTELKVAVMLFLAVYLADILITAHCFLNIAYVRAGEHRVLYAVTAALPFMAVRMLYAILCIFDNNKYFSAWSSAHLAVLVHGLMGILMEAIIVTIFITAGFLTSSVDTPAPQEGKYSSPMYTQETQGV